MIWPIWIMSTRASLSFNVEIKRAWLYLNKNKHSPQVFSLPINYSQRSSSPITAHQIKRHFNQDVKCSSVSVNGKNIKIYQHYFDQPVAQPRSPEGQRRIADLTGLKGITTTIILPWFPKDLFRQISWFIIKLKNFILTL